MWLRLKLLNEFVYSKETFELYQQVNQHTQFVHFKLLSQK